MKKSLLALAALTAFAGAASAQSSVTLYGRVDLSAGQGPEVVKGTATKQIANGSGSRLGFRGVEDLGGGMSALFNIEHRFNADTGVQTAGPIAAGPTSNAAPLGRFWTARSIVGLQGDWGQIVLGREYTTAFLQSQLVADPWGWDTVVSGTLGSGLNNTITGGAIGTVRNDSSATYKITMAGFTFGAQYAEGTDAITNVQENPYNLALSYNAGPFVFGLAHEVTGAETAAGKAKWSTINGSYNFGFARFGAFYGTGTTAADHDHRSYLVTATFPIGAGELRASYGQLKDKTADVVAAKGFGVGYHYSLSKRTTVYVDVMQNKADNILGTETGYDLGIKHNF